MFWHTEVWLAGAAIGFSDRPDAEMAAGLALSEAAAELGRDRVKSVILFAAGAHTVDAAALLEGARRLLSDVPIVVVGGPEVLLESGERSSGVAALCLSFPLVSALETPADEDLSPLGAAVHFRRSRPVMLFGQRTLLPSTLPGFASAAGSMAIVGGGVDPSAELGIAVPSEPARVGSALALRVDAGLRFAFEHAAAVQTISQLHRVDEISAGFVASIDGRAPLERLGRAVRDRHDRPLVLVAIHRGEGPPVIRGIGGIDPHRGALHVGDDVEVGDRFAFCVPRPDQARDDLEGALLRLRKSLHGGVPVLGLYFDSIGRGARLFGEPDVDVRLLRQHLPDVPFIGLRLASQILADAGGVRLAGHCGALALLYAPS